MLNFNSNVAGTTQMGNTVASAVSTYTATRSATLKSGGEGRVTTQALYDMPDPDEKFAVDLSVDDDTDGDDGTVV